MATRVELRTQFEAVGKFRILKGTADNRVRVLRERAGTIKLDGNGRGEERAANFRSGLRMTGCIGGRKKDLEHWVAGLSCRLTLEFFVELCEWERHFVGHEHIGWPGCLCPLQQTGRSAAAL